MNATPHIAIEYRQFDLGDRILALATRDARDAICHRVVSQ
jgi:hypothetical protein